jgi:hypothetical protein
MKRPTKGQQFRLRLSKFLMGVGLLMVAAMMYFESEPGLLPLAIATTGMGLYLGTKYQVRRKD